MTAGRAVLVHGLTSGAAAHWLLREHLEGLGWEVVTPTLLGHGGRGSAASFSLEAYAADLPDGPWDLAIGHSLGGAATLVASATPGWTSRLVQLDPAWLIPPGDRDAFIAEEVADLTPGPDAYAGWDPRDAEAKRSAVAGVTAETIVRTVDDNGPWDLRPLAAALTTPTLVLGADPDLSALLDPADGHAVSESNPLVEYRTIRGAGHSIHRDRPAELLAALDDWLART
jgi:pimeloyl-ACP methyl ester carboxylesterase